MTRANRPRYAARLNAFKQLSPGSDVKDWIVAAGQGIELSRRADDRRANRSICLRSFVFQGELQPVGTTDD